MSGSPRIVAAILATGSAGRYASPLPLSPLGGTTLLRTVAAQVCGTSCERVAVVAGAQATAIAPALAGLPVALETNVQWSEGSASALRCAVAWALRSRADALLIVVCDDARIPAHHLERLLERYRRARTLTASKLGPIIGVPAVFDRAQFPRLGGLAGECSAKLVIGTTAQVETIEWPPMTGRTASRDSLAIRAAS